MTGQSPVAGWYPDSVEALSERWWDGEQWTAATRPRPTVSSNAHLDAPSASEEQGVPFFGARARARELIAQNNELRAALARFDGMSLIEVERTRRKTVEEVSQLRAQVQTQRSELEQLAQQILDVRHSINIQELGLYDFEHPAEESADLANKLSALRLEIKQYVASGDATVASQSFTFNNSAAKGRKFVKDMSRTMLAAYNAEAENCIKAVRAGGLETARARLDRVVQRVERNGTMIDLQISPRYHRLRLAELTLAAKHMAAVKAEKEAERERRAELREQKKAEEELRRERERLEKEREHYNNALAALRSRGDDAGAEGLLARIADIEKAIEDVDYRVANVRAGYVYVISNVGAFGEGMVKIGMTRRLDPVDRVRELGDASVPFRYDIHAIFFSDDAVGVEAMLHRTFSDKRVNQVNVRREFFYVSPSDVLGALREHKVAIVEFTSEPDAEEFRLSQAAAHARREAPATQDDGRTPSLPTTGPALPQRPA